MAHDPDVAEEFANLAGRTGAAIVPARLRRGRTAQIDDASHLSNPEVEGVILDAWASGFEPIVFKKYTTPGGKTGQVFTADRRPRRQPESVNPPLPRSPS